MRALLDVNVWVALFDGTVERGQAAFVFFGQRVIEQRDPDIHVEQGAHG